MAALEKHYSIDDIAALWNLSPDTVRKIFADRADVLKICRPSKRKRRYVTLRIPESALMRMYAELRKEPQAA